MTPVLTPTGAQGTPYAFGEGAVGGGGGGRTDTLRQSSIVLPINEPSKPAYSIEML